MNQWINIFKINKWSFRYYKKHFRQKINQALYNQKTLMNSLVLIIRINIFRQWEKLIMSHNAKIAPILMSLGRLSINRTHMVHPTLQCIQVLLSITILLTFRITIRTFLRTNRTIFKICKIYKIRIINI